MNDFDYTPPTPLPVLYVLMRNDLPSMNTGKGMAQSCHIGSAFAHEMLVGKFPNAEANAANDTLYRQWLATSKQGFGTVLTVELNEEKMRRAVDVARSMFLVAGVLRDDTYPILVPPELGKVMATERTPISHFTVGERFNYVTIELDTCAFVFGDKNDPKLNVVTEIFPLHP